jgi:ATP-dependent DNA helicase RecQ
LQQHKEDAGIIYCNTRRQVDELSQQLQQMGYAALPYHAGLDSATREQNQRRFSRDEIKIIVATVAFGMGIDKSNVRFVAHFNLPKDLESYYQEIGRAGRDGLPANCHLLYSRQDLITIERILSNDNQNNGQALPAEQLHGAKVRLQAMWRFAEQHVCRRHDLLGYFGETYGQAQCGQCDNCRQPAGANTTTDLTIPAQKFLSCVVRTKQKFGASHIIDVLRGSRNQKVLQFGHDKLSTYNIGTEFSKTDWQTMAQQFIQGGLLVQDMEYGSLQVTEKGWRVLRSEEKFHGRVLPPSHTTTSTSTSTPLQTHRYPELVAQLREKRAELATAQNVPAYIIFSDRSLADMATYLPTTASDLVHLHGIGQAKASKYADDFLPILHAFRTANPQITPPRIPTHHPVITPLQPPAQLTNQRANQPTTQPINASSNQLTPSTAQAIQTTLAHYPNRAAGIVAAYQAGYSFDEIAQTLNVKVGTTIGNFEKHITETGQIEQLAIDPTRLRAECSLSDDLWQRAIAAFTVHGTERLKPAFEALGEAASYDDLRLVRLTVWLKSNA